jgi:hypothetical protein
MGKLSGYTEPKITVQVKSGEGVIPLVCRGLSVDEFLSITRDYMEYLSPVYDAAKDGKLDQQGLFDFLVKTIEEVPLLANMIVFFGIDGEEDDFDKISKMPIGTKIELIEAIVTLTFHSEQSSGKVKEIVMSTLTKAAQIVQSRPKA